MSTLTLLDFARAYAKPSTRNERLVDLWLSGTGRKEPRQYTDNDDILRGLERKYTTPESPAFVCYAYHRWEASPQQLRDRGVEPETPPYIMAQIVGGFARADAVNVFAACHGDELKLTVHVEQEDCDDVAKAYLGLARCIETDEEPALPFTSEQRKLVLLSGLEDMSDDRPDLSSTVAQLDTLQKEANEREKQIEKLRALVLNSYAGKAYKSVRINAGGKFLTLNKSLVNRLDTTALKAEQPDIAEKYTRTTESVRLAIKGPKV